MKEISIDELLGLPRDSYELIDIRDEELALYGMIPGAVNINIDALEDNEKIKRIPKNKKLVFYCQIGRRSREIEDLESLNGRECLSLKEGYIGYVRSRIPANGNNEEIQHKAEECIRKKFHKQLFTPFAKACKDYRLISDGDHIAVCISGGKDSILMAKLFQEIQRHKKVRFDLTFLVMDPGYNKENRALIESKIQFS